MEQLDNPVRPYAWGSRTVIAELLGQPVPSPHPQAEMWLGAHPADPSALVSADGSRRLAGRVAWPRTRTSCSARRGPGTGAGTLPYLLKVLAADEPLSLQAHPSLEQAAGRLPPGGRGGHPAGRRHRNYRDANHKPELICALTEFHALVGFREPGGLGATAARAGRAGAGRPRRAAGRRAERGRAARPVHHLDHAAAGGARHAGARAAGRLRAAGRRCGNRRSEFQAEARTALELSERYPGDAGVLAALLLNRVTLAPGEALFLPAGNLHAYLSGAGVELMANSDNVLRGGLTPKHVDVPELLRVLDFGAATAAGAPAGRTAPGSATTPRSRSSCCAAGSPRRRPAAAPDDPTDHVAVPEGGPRILLCTAGFGLRARGRTGSSRSAAGCRCGCPRRTPG